MSLAIEAAELMEHFQWISAEESRRAADDPDRLAAVGDELADVLCYALAMANELGLDLSTAIRRQDRQERAEVSRRRVPRPLRAGRQGGMTNAEDAEARSRDDEGSPKPNDENVTLRVLVPWHRCVLAGGCRTPLPGSPSPTSTPPSPPPTSSPASPSPATSSLDPLGGLERSLIFLPARYPDGNWQPAGLQFEDAWFAAADGTRLHGWYVPHEQPRAVILFATATPATSPTGPTCRGCSATASGQRAAFRLSRLRPQRGKAERGRRAGRRPGRPTLAGRPGGHRRKPDRPDGPLGGWAAPWPSIWPLPTGPRPGAGKHVHLDARRGQDDVSRCCRSGP